MSAGQVIKHFQAPVTGTPGTFTRHGLSQLAGIMCAIDSYYFLRSHSELKLSSLMLTGLWESCRHFILRGVNVTCSPAALSTESHQSLDQHLEAHISEGDKEKSKLFHRILVGEGLNNTSLISWYLMADFRTRCPQNVNPTVCFMEIKTSVAQCFDHVRLLKLLLQSGQWCECSQQFWHQPMVSHSVLAFWGRSEPTYLKKGNKIQRMSEIVRF